MLARNIVRNWRRSRRLETVDVDEQQIFEIKDSVNQSPEIILLDSELNGKVFAALHALDEDKQRVFILKVLRQFSYEEISQITGSSVPKLRIDLHRARLQL